MFESVDARTDGRADGCTHARTDAQTPARVPSYKLPLWAFGSGELKTGLYVFGCPRFWPPAPPWSMYPGVSIYGKKANAPRNPWSTYKCFLVSECLRNFNVKLYGKFHGRDGRTYERTNERTNIRTERRKLYTPRRGAIIPKSVFLKIKKHQTYSLECIMELMGQQRVIKWNTLIVHRVSVTKIG